MSAVTGLIIAYLAFSVYGSPSSQISGGHDAIFPHPYQAALFFRLGSGENRYFCGGAIINKRYVITAANCLASQRNLDFYIGVGSILLNETTLYRVDTFIPHAGYNKEAGHFGTNNIGLVYVTADIAFNENVQPIKLADSDRDYEGYPLIVSGWGKTVGSSPKSANTLQELVVKGLNYCNSWNKRILCVEAQQGEGICDLDNGNPVVADGVLVGVMAPRFVECGRNNWVDPCTRIFYYKTWIEYHVGTV